MWRLELVANILYFSPTTWYEFEQQSSNFKERTVLQCKAMTSVYTTGISIQKTVSIFQRLHYSKNAKKICLSSTCINNTVMIWYIQIVSEKAFCHSQIGLISLQNILVTFYTLLFLKFSWFFRYIVINLFLFFSDFLKFSIIQ